MAVNLTARYVRGQWTALVTGHGTALLDPAIGEEQVQQVWSALSEGRGVGGCLEVLAAGGFTNLPSFALVQHGEDELRVLVRGEAEVTSGENTVGAAGIATWREALLPGQQYRVEAAVDGAAGPEWPLAGGVVLASRVDWIGTGDGAPEGAAAAGTGEGDGSGDEAGEDGDADPEPAADPEPGGDADHEPGGDADPEPATDAEPEEGADAEPEEGDAHGAADAGGAPGEAAAGIGVAAPVVAAAGGGVVDADVEGGGIQETEQGESADAVEQAEDAGETDGGDAPAGASFNQQFEETEHPAESEQPEDGDAPAGASLDEHADPDEGYPEESASAPSAEDADEDEHRPEVDHGPDADDAGDEHVLGVDHAGDDYAAEDHAAADDAAADGPGADASSPADTGTEVSAYTAEEESAPSPVEGADMAADADDYPSDAPTLTASGSDIIDSLPWAVSASDREEAQAAQDRAAAELPETPTFEEPSAVDDGGPVTADAAEGAGTADTGEEELPEHTVVSRPGSEGPAVPAPPAQPADPAAAEADGGVISFDSLMAQQVPSAPADQPQQPGGYGEPAPGGPASQPAPAPYGTSTGFGAPPAPQGTPPPWAPPAHLAQPGPIPQGQGDVDIEGDHDGETIMVSQLPTGNSAGAAPGTGPGDLYDEPQAQPQATIQLVLSTGVHVPLDRPVLIGRAPESARFNAGVQPRLVTVASPEQDISRTHVEVRAEGGHAVVTDLNSTNGTVVVQPGSPPRRLHPGEGASVPTGTVVDLGDGVTVNVQAADQGTG